MSFPLVTLILSALLSYGVIKLVARLRWSIQACQSVPSWNFQLFDTSKNLRFIGPKWPKGKLGDLTVGFQPYAEAGSTALATVPLQTLQPCFWFSGAGACDQILQHGELFRKDMSSYAIIEFHGPNIVTSEGVVWKRHRHAVRGSFSEKNYPLVWDEAGRTLDEWFDALGLDMGAGDVEVDVITSLRKVTLNIIASAGFGQHFPWKSSDAQKSPTEMSFPTSIIHSMEHIFWRMLTPQWAYSLPVPQIARTKLAYGEMERHIISLIHEGARTDDTRDTERLIAPGSLLKGLLEANGALEDKLRLSDRELLSNIYVFLLAGHETTAHTMTFVMAILALYPDIHARVREEADNIWPDPAAYQASTYKSDFTRLPYTLALFYETLRHLPSEPILTRIVTQDTVLPASKRNSDTNKSDQEFDQEYTVMVPKDSVVVTDFYAMHMNTQYWGPTATDFDPSRFLSPNWPKHAFAPFSGGQRACIGRGFATAEAVRIIAGVAQAWDVRCKEDLMELPWEERKRRLLRWRQDVTKAPVDVRLMFSRRQR
ncbi:hypothetical protein FRC09_005146 [Ceratobasidium sp. 395]|nr:hypothetical protein FRC09_005146 [Ceratobasidium sp. 395]